MKTEDYYTDEVLKRRRRLLHGRGAETKTKTTTWTRKKTEDYYTYEVLKTKTEDYYTDKGRCSRRKNTDEEIKMKKED
ncbi:unnamed protein product [Arctia plantaginis]|uniref:Uncharacterized protein n=1 Tax=Arctia plantaginis TaxID=874455 RepID=A0A8S1APS7_ARCPL|nr:unnamed protein product [Arctia plantaginis]